MFDRLLCHTKIARLATLGKCKQITSGICGASRHNFSWSHTKYSGGSLFDHRLPV